MTRHRVAFKQDLQNVRLLPLTVLFPLLYGASGVAGTGSIPPAFAGVTEPCHSRKFQRH